MSLQQGGNDDARNVSNPNESNSGIDVTKTSIDIELTHTAFRLPRVIDPAVESEEFSSRKSYFAELPTEILSSKPPLKSTDSLDFKKIEFKQIRKAVDEHVRALNHRKFTNRNVNFTDIVDVDINMLDNHVKQNIAGRFVDSQIFKMAMLIVILLNSVLIGLQTDATLDRKGSTIFYFVDYIFLAVFIMEIVFKWYTNFWDFWKNAWNWFDVIVVFAALAGPGVAFLSNTRTIRVLRVMRTLRSLKSIDALQGLYMVVETILNSIPDMINIMFLLVLLMFIWSVLGVTLFGEISPEHFGTLSRAMFSMFTVTTEDGWVNIVDNLQAKGEFAAAALFFISFVTVGDFFITKMVVAVVVSNFEEAFSSDKKRKKMMNRSLKTSSHADQGKKLFEKNVEPGPEKSDFIWREQLPLETLNFDKISKKKLNNYFLILAIIEENLREYTRIKAQLADVLEGIKQSNQMSEDEASGYSVDIDDEDEDEDEDGQNLYTDAQRQQDEGDVLTQIMKGKMK